MYRQVIELCIVKLVLLKQYNIIYNNIRQNGMCTIKIIALFLTQNNIKSGHFFSHNEIDLSSLSDLVFFLNNINCRTNKMHMRLILKHDLTFYTTQILITIY